VVEGSARGLTGWDSTGVADANPLAPRPARACVFGVCSWPRVMRLPGPRPRRRSVDDGCSAVAVSEIPAGPASRHAGVSAPGPGMPRRTIRACCLRRSLETPRRGADGQPEPSGTESKVDNWDPDWAQCSPCPRRRTARYREPSPMLRTTSSAATRRDRVRGHARSGAAPDRRSWLARGRPHRRGLTSTFGDVTPWHPIGSDQRHPVSPRRPQMSTHPFGVPTARQVAGSVNPTTLRRW
jgi:hypothetical protein